MANLSLEEIADLKACGIDEETLTTKEIQIFLAGMRHALTNVGLWQGLNSHQRSKFTT